MWTTQVVQTKLM